MPSILFFGKLREAAGGPSRQLALPPDIRTGNDLRRWLGAQDALLGAALSGCGVIIVADQTIVSPEADISGAIEIAFLPPLSGG